MRSTLTEIAASAGVSVSTVSKVLNGRTDVSPATRDRIARLLADHGYRTAGTPTAGSGIVDLVIGGLQSPWADALVAGAVGAGVEADCRIVVNDVPDKEGRKSKELAATLERVAARGTDGVLIVHHLPARRDRDRLAAKGVPLVIIDPPEEPGAGVRSVASTNWHGGLAATRHLLELGHHRIAALGGPPHTWSARARVDGYRAALLQAGVPVDEKLVHSAAFSPEAGRAYALHLLDLPEPPTAIAAGNDAQAFGVLQALAERGLRAPYDMSVTGFDDVSVAAWAAPALTTVRQPLEAMAATAFRMLRLVTTGSAAPPEQVELATTLIVRESTAPPSKESSPSQ
ncbi:LacI family transcriptional regulator [Streptomyces sp. A7024]|uniref:LacI family transcriptional regulator n=1 Tax=Streptomyces coryli TaxID=1128680 RepID=A0A6G4U6I7_9ACTN|nr:LacI family DNA-binding transcriptional regulator [Streptomyces coryli]NGN67794.1 LacI family transcriptional regulator [Streptomyces coryli]